MQASTNGQGPGARVTTLHDSRHINIMRSDDACTRASRWSCVAKRINKVYTCRRLRFTQYRPAAALYHPHPHERFVFFLPPAPSLVSSINACWAAMRIAQPRSGPMRDLGSLLPVVAITKASAQAGGWTVPAYF